MKSRGVESERIRLYSSLAQFNQECSITSLPEAVPVQKGVEAAPAVNYQQLLLDGKEWVETLLRSSLPEFLSNTSGVRAPVEDLDLLAVSAPTDVQSLPERMMDARQRLLQFSAEYRVAVEFSINRSHLHIWCQHLSFHQRREVDKARLRVMCTVPVRVSFRMVERGEETEAFSIESIVVSRENESDYRGIDPVAVRLGQRMIRAPQHENWGTIPCEGCGDRFAVGYHRFFPPTETYGQLAAKLQDILSKDHRHGRVHSNLYGLVSPYRTD